MARTDTTAATTGVAAPIESSRCVRGQRHTTKTKPPSHTDSIPQSGLGRWRHFGRFVGVSREKWRQLVLEGKAPQPTRMGARIALYEFAEIHEWLADPLNYHAPEATKTAPESTADTTPPTKPRKARTKRAAVALAAGAEGA